jgi:hypothetical protein
MNRHEMEEVIERWASERFLDGFMRETQGGEAHRLLIENDIMYDNDIDFLRS